MKSVTTKIHLYFLPKSHEMMLTSTVFESPKIFRCLFQARELLLWRRFNNERQNYKKETVRPACVVSKAAWARINNYVHLGLLGMRCQSPQATFIIVLLDTERQDSFYSTAVIKILSAILQASLWSNCSSNCGGGVIRRSVTCMDATWTKVNDSLCDPNTRPQGVQSCSPDPCPECTDDSGCGPPLVCNSDGCSCPSGLFWRGLFNRSRLQWSCWLLWWLLRVWCAHSRWRLLPMGSSTDQRRGMLFPWSSGCLWSVQWTFQGTRNVKQRNRKEQKICLLKKSDCMGRQEHTLHLTGYLI